MIYYRRKNLHEMIFFIISWPLLFNDLQSLKDTDHIVLNFNLKDIIKMMRYNLCFIPNTTQEQDSFISYTSRLKNYIIGGKIDRYCLNKNTIPHITLVHVDATKKDIEMIWKKFIEIEPRKSIQFTFEIEKTNLHNGLMWRLLMPNELELLHSIHNNLLTIVKDPKNISGKYYDPHLTLLSSTDIDKPTGNKKIPPLTANFTLALTERDEVGQSTKIIYRHQEITPQQKIMCRL